MNTTEPSSPRPILAVAHHLLQDGLPADRRPVVGDIYQFHVARVTERDYHPAGVVVQADLAFAGQLPAGLPPIVFADEAKESWIAQIEAMAGWHAQITLTDGTTRDVVLRGHVYGPDSLVGLAVQYWVDDKEPPDDAPVEGISSSDIARIRIY